MKKTKKKIVSTFVYHGGMVFEIDSKGIKHPRKDIGPDHKGNFKKKFK